MCQKKKNRASGNVKLWTSVWKSIIKNLQILNSNHSSEMWQRCGLGSFGGPLGQVKSSFGLVWAQQRCGPQSGSQTKGGTVRVSHQWSFSFERFPPARLFRPDNRRSVVLATWSHREDFLFVFVLLWFFFLNCLKTFDFENITVFFSSSSLLQFCLVLILTNSVGRDRIITILWWSAGQNVDPDTQPEASDEIPCFSVTSGNSKKNKNQNNNRVTTGSDVEP